jgi:uridine phosphorylase
LLGKSGFTKIVLILHITKYIKMNRAFQHSELILNEDGSVYHLHLKAADVAQKVILVGDPGRVAKLSSLFDTIDFRIQNREFVTHSGYYKGVRISAISTGIGTDNIDIVMNELDAAVNIDLENRVIRKQRTRLDIVRIGTTGGLQAELGVGSFVLSRMAGGFDGLIHFYRDGFSVCDEQIEKAFINHTGWYDKRPTPYFVRSSDTLFNLLNQGVYSGITLSSPGFYGPQGRTLRLDIVDPGLNEKMQSFNCNGLKITNYEMESSALFGLSALLGHEAVSICAVIANRVTGGFIQDHDEVMDRLLKFTLERLVEKK